MKINSFKASISYIKQKSKRLEKKNRDLEISINLLEDSNKKLQRYAYTIAHDLKAPLRAINGFGKLLHKKHQRQLDPEAQEFLQFIVEESKNMSLIISETLITSTPKNPKGKYPVDLNKILVGVEKTFRATLRSAETTIKKDDLPIVMATSSEMIQIFQNLMCNAIKFKKTNVPLHITIKSRETNDAFYFSFSDNGVGISPNDTAKVFKFLTRLRNREGQGIGLFTCKSIVESYSGKISVKSVLGIGTTFHFSISKQVNSAQKVL